MNDGEAFLPLPSVCHLRVLARTVGTGDTQVCPLLSCFGAVWRCLEIEGLPNMKVEQAFELSDASAERSASGCSVRLNKEPIIEYLKSNIVMLRWMIASGYGDAKTLERRAVAMEEWIENPELLEPDADAEYAEIIEIDLNEITEPLLACPNDPDDIKPLSEVANTEIQEVFIGSCIRDGSKLCFGFVSIRQHRKFVRCLLHPACNIVQCSRRRTSGSWVCFVHR